MGYSSSQKGYKCYNSHTVELVISRDIRFDELTLFFHKDSENNPQGESLMDTFPLPTPGEIYANPPNPIINSNIDEVVSEEVPSAPTPQPQAATPQSVVAPRRNPARDRHPPLRLQEYVTYSARYPISEAITYQKLSAFHALFLNQLSNNLEPRGF
ncbi:hypothetical protein ACFX2H_023598 [Malus domestica]